LIKNLTIKNFESHEYSEFSFDKGFNLICGESDSGKTSIVRAIRLVAYNDFDPRSVRVGHDNCEITIQTHRGSVKVTRGKVNVWEVTPDGEKTESYKRVGRSVLEAAAKIIGLNAVKLGDVQISVNIMEQLEGHFMLSQLDGKNASGSARAQIVDEISGLTGIETLIHGISLDNIRTVKKIKSLDFQNKDLSAKMHDVNALAYEETIISKASKFLEKHEEDTEICNLMGVVAGEFVSMSEKIEKSQDELSDIIETDKPGQKASTAGEIIDKVLSAKVDYERTVGVRKNISDIEERIDNIPRTKSAGVLIARIQENRHKAEVSARLTKLFLSAENSIRDKGKLIEDIDEQLKELTNTKDELLSDFKTCPLTLQPASRECLEKAT